MFNNFIDALKAGITAFKLTRTQSKLISQVAQLSPEPTDRKNQIQIGIQPVPIDFEKLIPIIPHLTTMSKLHPLNGLTAAKLKSSHFDGDKITFELADGSKAIVDPNTKLDINSTIHYDESHK